MYCRRCYADLHQATFNRCPQCGRGFDPGDRKSYLRRPFPSRRKIIWQIVGTTLLGVVAAFVVAIHQGIQASGH